MKAGEKCPPGCSCKRHLSRGSRGSCAVEGCDRECLARGFCNKHYQRFRVGADPHTPSLKERTPEDRFWSKVDVGLCWTWTGGRDYDGYGVFGAPGRVSVRAHRWAWRMLVGPISDDRHLDHLCRNRACVNPDHLEPVTSRVNTMRGPTALATINARKTECIRGHPFDLANTRITSTGARACRACDALYPSRTGAHNAYIRA